MLRRPATGVGVAMLRTLQALNLDRRGATAVQYGLLDAMIVIVIVGGLRTRANMANKVSAAEML